jgi:hypothetical protein
MVHYGISELSIEKLARNKMNKKQIIVFLILILLTAISSVAAQDNPGYMSPEAIKGGCYKVVPEKCPRCSMELGIGDSECQRCSLQIKKAKFSYEDHYGPKKGRYIKYEDK